MITNKTIRDHIILKKIFSGSGEPTYDTRTASGAISTFNTNVVMPLRSLTAQIVPIQEGTGDPSPQNPRPISGTSVLNVEQRGVSSFDEQTELGTLDVNTGEETSSTTQLRVKNYVPVKNGTSYYLKSSRTMWVLFYDRQKNVISDGLPSGGGQAGNARSFINTTIAIPSNCFFIRWYWVSGYGTIYLDDTSLNYPSTDTDYHAYTGKEDTIDFGRTVYGGSAEVVGGEGEVTHGMVDFSDLNWSFSGSGTSARWYCSDLVSLIKLPTSSSQILDMTMEKFRPINYGVTLSNYPDYISVLSDGRLISYKYDGNSPSGLCVYPLSTPTDFTFTGQEINSLEGVNNIWTDAGDSEVSYLYQTGEGGINNKTFLPFFYPIRKERF